MQRGLLLLGIALMACALIAVRPATPQPTVLYLSPHAEIAPFSRSWDPSRTIKVEDDEWARRQESGPVKDELCGNNGDDCPDIPAFNGEDYFDDKPLGCCYSKEQQHVWDKWKALKERVAKLEGEVHYLRNIKRGVWFKRAYDVA